MHNKPLKRVFRLVLGVYFNVLFALFSAIFVLFSVLFVTTNVRYLKKYKTDIKWLSYKN
ncbi:hypothetical protein D3C73_500700 [compost metagenome]